MIAVDLDGTLAWHRWTERDPEPLTPHELADFYGDPAAIWRVCVPNEALLAYLRYRVGMRNDEVAYVSGRGRVLEAATRMQLQDWGAPEGSLHLQESWRGYEAMVDWKAARLLALGASVYIGDHDADRRAARRAGCDFWHADLFSHGLRTSPSLRPLVDPGVRP